MNTLWTMILLTTMSQAALAGTTMVNNPYLPYPPGCGRMPDLDAPGGIESQAIKFYDREIRVIGLAENGEPPVSRVIPMTLRAYRAQCDAFNRSLIWLEFVLPAQTAGEDMKIPLPWLRADVLEHGAKFPVLSVEPGTWASAGRASLREEQYLLSRAQAMDWYYHLPGGDRRWVYLLDNASPLDDYWNSVTVLTTEEYNSRFALTLDFSGLKVTLDIPSTFDLVWEYPALSMPLSGRLSGNWVVPGASDQGVLLSISERVQPDSPAAPNRDRGPMVLFLAHYTYDAAGDLLWLTGAAQFEPGATEVTIPIERVTNGQFRSSRQADRAVVGSVTLKTIGCNELEFDYDYSGAGLGVGEVQVQRLFSLEIAGHECQDFETRWAAMQ